MDPAKVSGPAAIAVLGEEEPGLRGWQLVDRIVAANRTENDGRLKKNKEGRLWVPAEAGGCHLCTQVI